MAAAADDGADGVGGVVDAVVAVAVAVVVVVASMSAYGGRMVFPQWMWILCVVALQAVRQAIARAAPPDVEPEYDDEVRVLCVVCETVRVLRR